MHEPPISSDDQQAAPSELTELHNAITATLRERLPLLELVEAYPVLEEGMKLPALLYAATNFAPGVKPGDGRLCLKVTFEAVVLLESGRALAPLQAAILAGKVMQVLDDQYWNLDFVGGVENIQAMPAELAPDLVRCVGWALQWQQDVYLGETAWVWDDQPPGSLMFAFDPESGADNQGEYFPPESVT